MGPDGAKPLLAGHTGMPAPHRDTHVHLQLGFRGRGMHLPPYPKRSWATNDFEFMVVGTRGSRPGILRPDEVECGSEAGRLSCRAKPPAHPVRQTVHGMGWLEGYVEITRQTLRRLPGWPLRKFLFSASPGCDGFLFNAIIEK